MDAFHGLLVALGCAACASAPAAPAFAVSQAPHIAAQESRLVIDSRLFPAVDEVRFPEQLDFWSASLGTNGRLTARLHSGQVTEQPVASWWCRASPRT